LKSVTDLSVVSSHSPGWSLKTTVAAVRSGTALAIDRHVGDVEGSFLKGLLLGDRSDIQTELKSSFVNAGVIHILAVSGSNVGMVALIFVSVFSLLRVRKTVTTLLTVGSLLFYMLLTGSAASVVRATIMATIILLAPVFQRKSDVFNSLAFSALLIFFVDAKQLFDPGFQLSFAAVASILYFYPKIAALWDYFPEKVHSMKLLDFLWKLFAVSLAAQIGTVPFTVAYFGKVSIVSLAANLFVIPAAGVGLALGFSISLFSTFWTWLAGIYGAAAQLLLGMVLKVIDFSGNLSFAYLSVSSFSVLDFLIFYVGAVFIFNLREKVVRRKLVFALLILGNVAILPGALGENPKMRVTVLDV
ncbi:MAG: ComEC/Rec2 family competence protein, partial [Bacteroidota bacterium]